MADFRKAFQNGIDAYAAVEAVRADVLEMIGAAGKTVVDATDGKIRLRPKAPDRVAAILSGIGDGEIQWLVVAESDNGTAEVICTITVGAKGFPVAVQRSTNHEACHDKESVEEAFERVLAHPSTGAKFRNLLASAPEPPPSPPG